jgi:hypothetical protein
MTSYLAKQYKDREGGGCAVLYQDNKVWWDWYSSEYGTPNPMAGIPRPKGKNKGHAHLAL